MIKKIAVIGAGTMGNGIAHVFAQNGYSTHLIDLSQESLDRGMATIGKNLDRMITKELIQKTDKKNTLEKISTFTSLTEGVKEADLVIEAATEDTELKLRIFGDLDRSCHEATILA